MLQLLIFFIKLFFTCLNQFDNWISSDYSLNFLNLTLFNKFFCMQIISFATIKKSHSVIASLILPEYFPVRSGAELRRINAISLRFDSRYYIFGNEATIKHFFKWLHYNYLFSLLIPLTFESCFFCYLIIMVQVYTFQLFEFYPLTIVF